MPRPGGEDVRMPAMDGLEATRLIKARWPAVKIVVLSMYPEYQDEALAAGADAFVVKGDPQVQLLNCFAQITSRDNTTGCDRETPA